MTRRRTTGVLGVTAAAAVITVAAALGALAWSGILGPPAVDLPEAGAWVRWGLPALVPLRDLSAALTIGLLVLAAVVLPGARGRSGAELGGLRLRAVRLAAVAASGWFVCSVAVFVLSYADISGLGLDSVATWNQLAFFVDRFDLGKQLALSASAAALVAVGAALTDRVATAGWLTLLAFGAVVPLAFTGHAAGSTSHGDAVNSLAWHLIAVSVWVGGLAGLLLLRPRLGADAAVVVARYSGLAGLAYLLLVTSGALGAVVRVEDWQLAASSPYGVILGAKVLTALLLGWLGWQQRTRVVTGLSTSPSSGRLFVRLAGIELLLMAVAIGLGVALSRSVPPTSGTPEETSSALGYPLPGPLGGTGWITEWRWNSFWLPIAALATAAYVAGVVRLRRRGDRWPITRTLFWLAGWIVLTWATSGAPGVYGKVLFSVHMVEHMTIAMIVPILLVLAAPVSLVLRAVRPRRDGSSGAREWTLRIVHSRAMAGLSFPIVAALLLVGSLFAFYYTSLFDIALSTHGGHLVMTVHFLLAGYLFAWVICGPDPGPQRLAYPFRLMLLVATMGVHAFLAVSLMSASVPLAGEWFGGLDRAWGPSLLGDQYTGAALGWAMGDLPVALLTVAMAFAWARADDREARRSDRQAERDDDAALTAYNDFLLRQTTVAREGHQPPAKETASTSSPENVDPGRDHSVETDTSGRT